MECENGCAPPVKCEVRFLLRYSLPSNVKLLRMTRVDASSEGNVRVMGL